ncbi:uncharacterized protein LOC116012859 [Ipomoea triloba]|uniref:uncharacterized protein LOC116012859 n=1 Tax=Ipomoea triloba TaxID=35885 RepID=UPI00125D3859|nr:uncharacterized protein LOC116012859 [Ipomoea triloba]
MAKAYDRMEWPFLRKMLLASGFSIEWVNLVMLRVTTVSYNVLVNGANVGQVVPTRELLGEHPWYHICSLQMIVSCVSKQLLWKQELSSSALLNTRICLGRRLNFHKSSVCLSRNTSEFDRNKVAAILGVVQAPNFGKYLGLPFFVRRDKRVVFSYIEDKIKHMIGWRSKKLISQARKEVLIKSVAQSMPTFTMSVFLLPDSVCLSIKRAMNRYWWGSGIEKAMPHELDGSLVSGLIDLATGTWDQSIVQDIFDSGDVDLIMRVPITP